MTLGRLVLPIVQETLHLSSLLPYGRNEPEHRHVETTSFSLFQWAHPPGAVAVCPKENVCILHQSGVGVEDFQDPLMMPTFEGTAT
ncbi:hypothetical protein Pcinc_010658 [Petrolisthes cinctipes]|uniref:Uncharacterized protein n=1 Tax=Petrolisthes cinctipes TaxID=88211 RepID=A0AAE1G509_PETCI|nr:hypothetical protein Pcinc_010658 [Petrolisthes cinctipes]